MNTTLLILTLLIRYERMNVCAADTTNHPITIEMQDSAILRDLVQHIMLYHEDGYDAIPNTGQNLWWQLSYDHGTLAYICDNHRECSYANIPADTPLKDIFITAIYARPAELPTDKPGGL